MVVVVEVDVLVDVEVEEVVQVSSLAGSSSSTSLVDVWVVELCSCPFSPCVEDVVELEVEVVSARG